MRPVLPLAAALVLTADPALADEPPCFPRADVLAAAAEKFGQVPAVQMLDARGGVVEILAAPDGSSFVMIAVSPDMTACLVGGGQAIEFIAAPKPGSAR
jgi:hypothetical protein